MKTIVSILALSVSLVSFAFSQEHIKGVVKDDEGVPVPGATVVIKGTSIFATTDVNGQFALAAKVNYPFSLLFNLVGYRPEEVEVYEPLEDPLEVNLKLDNVLNEIVVVGYGTQKKDDLTGAVASVPKHLFD